MAFNKKYKNIEEVLKAFEINYQETPLILLSPQKTPSVLKEDLDFTLPLLDYKSSESAIREYVISPILKTVWKAFAQDLLIWIEKPIYFDEQLNGVPDYIISKRSPKGKIFFEHPHLAVLEAKKDDFTAGWSQCALEMIAIQRINATPEKAVYGMVSNGDIWEMGKLEGQVFTKYEGFYTLKSLDELYGAVYTIFGYCKD